LESKENNLSLEALLRRTIILPTFSPTVKLMNINRYQQARTTQELKSTCARFSKPFRKTPKLGNSQAAKLANIAAIETKDGFRMILGGRDMFIFAGTAMGGLPVRHAI
jgi:hypothetical protein